MVNSRDILETINMIDNEHLDVRTITMGISLLDCIDSNIQTACTKVYDKICRYAKDLVKTGEDISKEYGIPIINKRIAVSPIAMLAGACNGKSPIYFAHALDKAAKEVGVNFIGGYSALVHKGFSAGDYALISSIPQALAETDFVCSSVNIGSTKAGINMDAVAAYPEFLACDPENMHEVWLQQGISTDVINVANPQAMQFARDVIDELIDLFPFRYIHLGGDECPTNKWQKNEECQSLLKEMGSTNFRDLQIYFYKQLKDYMATKPANQQRRLVFWNEVLHGNTALLGNDITIMAWIGADAAAQNAAKQGMSTILSPQIPYYINRRQSDLPTEPMSQGHGTETVEAVYNYQPMKGVEADLQPYYSGVQANFWTEWVVDSSVLEYLMLPRLAAVAEAGWTPQEKRDYVSFEERIRKDAVLYDLKGWNYGKHIMK